MGKPHIAASLLCEVCDEDTSDIGAFDDFIEEHKGCGDDE